MKANLDIAAVAAHFNFPEFKAPKRNLHRFIRYIKSLGVDLYGVELVLEGHQAVTVDNPLWRQIYVDKKFALWQKEALWNYALKLVPQEIRKVICCDTDIWCDDVAWLERVSLALETANVVHPFRHAHQTGPDGSVSMTVESVISAGLSRDVRSHPGYCWAFKRSLWEEGPGLWDSSIGGNGDRFLAYAVMAREPLSELIVDNQDTHCVAAPFICDSFARWAADFKNWMGDSFGFVNVNLFHEYHGSKEDRQYMTRRELLESLLEKELARDSRGIWYWTAQANPLRAASFLNYFAERREDN